MKAITPTAAERWAHIRNVEAVFCWLPDWEQVLDGTHTITAVGHDGMAVNILVDTAKTLEAPDGFAELTQLAYIGRHLTRFRYLETIAGMPEIGDCHA